MPFPQSWPLQTRTQTEAIGQDGISYAPVRTFEQLSAIREQIAGWNGNPTVLHDYSIDTEKADRKGNLRLLTCGPCDVVATDDQVSE